jgi:hypothetical protein
VVCAQIRLPFAPLRPSTRNPPEAPVFTGTMIVLASVLSGES